MLFIEPVSCDNFQRPRMLGIGEWLEMVRFLLMADFQYLPIWS